MTAKTKTRFRHRQAFTMIEMLAVMAVIMVLVSIVTVSVTNLIEGARRSSALSSIEATFRAAQISAIATSRERRVVLKLTYQASAGYDIKEIYASQPKLEFWMEKKKNDAMDWENLQSNKPIEKFNYEALDDPDSPPGGVMLTDIDGGLVIPKNAGLAVKLSSETASGLTSYAYYISVHFRPDGQITEIRGSNRDRLVVPPDLTTRKLTRNPALHFMFEGTTIDMSGVNPTASNYEYLSALISYGVEAWNPKLNLDPGIASAMEKDITTRFGPAADETHQFAGRSQVLTLYLMRITGFVGTFDYGIYPPWPKLPLPDELLEG